MKRTKLMKKKARTRLTAKAKTWWKKSNVPRKRVQTDFIQSINTKRWDTVELVWHTLYRFLVYLSQTHIQNDQWLLRFKYLKRSVDEKYLMRFQGETSVFKFLCIPFRPLFLTSCPILSAYVVSFYLFFIVVALVRVWLRSNGFFIHRRRGNGFVFFLVAIFAYCLLVVVIYLWKQSWWIFTVNIAQSLSRS